MTNEELIDAYALDREFLGLTRQELIDAISRARTDLTYRGLDFSDLTEFDVIEVISMARITRLNAALDSAIAREPWWRRAWWGLRYAVDVRVLRR